MPAEVSKPQSVPARTCVGSPRFSAKRTIRSATNSGCSTKLVVGQPVADDYSVFMSVAEIGEGQDVTPDVGR
jgi:hypothetical protein